MTEQTNLGGSFALPNTSMTLQRSNGEENHLHLVVRYAPQLQASLLITSKSVSSCKVRQEFEAQWREAYVAVIEQGRAEAMKALAEQCLALRRRGYGSKETQ